MPVTAWRVGAEAGTYGWLRPKPGGSGGHNGSSAAWWLIPAVVGGLALSWGGLILAFEGLRFVAVVPSASAAGVEVASASARLFAALILVFFPEEHVSPRLRWVAIGFGLLAFGPLGGTVGALDLNASLYAFLTIWSLAGACFVAGLCPRTPSRLTLIQSIGVLAVTLAVVTAVVLLLDRLPRLAPDVGLEELARYDQVWMPHLSAWHWVLSAAPLTLTLIALVGAAWRLPPLPLRTWLVVALILLAGAQLHGLFWPAGYQSLLTTSDVLRLVFSTVVAVGAILELRRIATERAELLAHASQAAERVRELAVLRADFTAMVAHELASPIAGIRRSAEVLATEPLSPLQLHLLETIDREVVTIDALVADVRTSAAIERDDFAVRAVPVELSRLLTYATASARSLPGDHSILWPQAVAGRVLADPQRISQVLRNLLLNAAKYTPEKSPIEVRAVHRGDRVRIEVADAGPGIIPEDRTRIFEKFGRGSSGAKHRPSGAGLGLYLSRQIVLAHGSDLTMESVPGQGATFAFELEVAP